MDGLDEFQRSVFAYKELVDNNIRYRIEFFSAQPLTVALGNEKTSETVCLQGNTINTLEIIFTPDEFKHLSSVHKLKDIDDLSRPLYEKAINISGHGKKFDMNNIRRSKSFFEDIDKSRNPETKDMTDEEFQGTIEKTKDKYFLSKLLGRLDSLEHLYSTITKSRLTEHSNDLKPLELKVYAWDRKALSSERPHNSDIKANFLIEIYDKNNSEKPYTDFFVVRGENETYRGMSVFPSEVSYAFDDTGRKVAELTALSLETSMNGKSISIISADEKIIADCRQREAEHNERVAEEMLQDPNKEERKKFFSKLGNQRSRLIKKENRLNKENYYKMIETDLFCSEFSEFDLKSLKSSMEQSMNVQNTSEKKKICLEYEIATVETIIELNSMIKELEQLLNQEDFSVDAYADRLSAVSAYLADRSVNVGRDLIMKAAEQIEQQKKSCDEFTAELIDDEVKKIKQTAEQKPEDRINFGRSGGFRTAQFHINMFTVHENTMSLTMPFEAILNGLANSFSQLQETVIEKIHDFVNKVKQTADSIMNTVSAKLHKKQNQDVEEQSESASEIQNEDTEKESGDDIISVLMDNAGVPSYENYFTIVPANRLDFHVPLTYETEKIQEKQDMEQEISAEKASVPVQKKQQVGYGDL